MYMIWQAVIISRGKRAEVKEVKGKMERWRESGQGCTGKIKMKWCLIGWKVFEDRSDICFKSCWEVRLAEDWGLTAVFGNVEVISDPDTSYFMEWSAEKSQVILSSRQKEGKRRRGREYRKLFGGCFAEGMGRKRTVTKVGKRREFYIIGNMTACLVL